MSRQAALDLVETLEPLRFPLRGSRLIEASAGTGKTYTIAALYVRLVLGHGGVNAFARALTPPEILVVTFTDAATQELRERIRCRLAQAAAAFLAGPGDTLADDLLRALRADYPPAAWPACARKLQLAAEWMDEAAVSTIHGWCNRMLREHAFDSDSLFSQTLAADQSELFAECVRDYWRSFMAPLDSVAVAEVRPWWPVPAALQRDLRRLIAYAGRLEHGGEPASVLRVARDARARRLADLKAPWAAWADALEQILDDALAAKRVDGRRLQARYYRAWLDALRGWAADPQAQAPDLKGGWTRLTPDGLRAAWKDGDPPAHAAFEALAQLAAQLAVLPCARNDVLGHAVHWVAQRFAQEQQRRAQLGFDDLLTRLAQALAGANGARLAQRLRAQFPVALIDEFQDTDPVQYRIFDAVYCVADDDRERERERALILIGDPKQAIYGFRGADIHTYLAARRACTGRLYTLRRNFRSTHDMVAATNHCFAGAERRSDGGGAFLFRNAGGNPLPFLAADAHGRSDAFLVDGQCQTALTLWWMAGEVAAEAAEAAAQAASAAPSKKSYLEQMAQVCASQMVHLLKRAQAGQAGFSRFAGDSPESAGGALAVLRPADMAVLVNNRGEAEAIRGALAARGVRSVYLSDKESVFACAQAAELQLWLAACAEPDDARRLRAALASATLGLSYGELDALNHDELAWEARVLQFRAYRESWRRQGVLPMLRRLLNDFGVPARLLGSNESAARSGERVLTDLLHLAELLQQASGLLDGEHALIRYLAEQRQEGGAAADDPAARQIRLESDADRVQVVTVHKSKGLEYPLVFLPFACASRPVKADDVPLAYHGEDGELHLALAADDAIVARADRERLGEDLRKLYVALTRARYATWIGVAALEHSALAHLLGDMPSPGGLDAWRGDCAQISVQAAPAPNSERLATPDVGRADEGGGQARRARRSVGENWWVASYSALRAEHGDLGGDGDDSPDASVERVIDAVADTALQDQFGETRAAPVAEAPAQAAALSATSGGALHDLPRGAELGSFLHGLLEAAARRGFARLAEDARGRRELVERRCQLRGWQRFGAPLADWLGRLLVTPLPLPATPGFAATPLRLAGLTSALAEMEFWMATQRVDVAAIDRLVCAQTLGGASRPALRAGQLNGMLKGFIDLVFEHDGRYYVADYKSNWLGPSDAEYTPEALRAAMLQARYELQYVLYLVALHRLLRSRRRDYDYDRHVGGALYLFLRATPESGHGVYTDRPPRALIEALDRLFAGAPKGMHEYANAVETRIEFSIMSTNVRASDWLAGDQGEHAAALRRVLQAWAERGWVRTLDVAFADFLSREVADAPALLLLAAALASHQLGRGHASLDLAAVLDDPALALSLPPDGGADRTPEQEQLPAPPPTELLVGLRLPHWLAALDQPQLIGRGAGVTPLVVAGTRVYLRRYWQYEQDLRDAIERRLQRAQTVQAQLPVDRLRVILGALFASNDAAAPGIEGASNWQKIACALAARSAFAVVTGGPGTGKTTTVVRLLALLQALALGAPAGESGERGEGGDGRAPRPLRIRLAAPTGKAAARLNASIAGAVASLPLEGLADGEAIRASIPVKVVTLHRLLGSRPETRHFRHHAGNRLALDVLVVDEASMIDLEMMTAVLAALPDSARIVLLGDKDQLASVEAGAVLGELCRNAGAGRYSAATARWLATACDEHIDAAFVDPAGSALDQAVVMLRHSYRFSAASGIGRLAAAVNAGDRTALRALWQDGEADLALLPLAAAASARGEEADGFAALVVEGGLAARRRAGDMATAAISRSCAENSRHSTPRRRVSTPGHARFSPRMVDSRCSARCAAGHGASTRSIGGWPTNCTRLR